MLQIHFWKSPYIAIPSKALKEELQVYLSMNTASFCQSLCKTVEGAYDML